MGNRLILGLVAIVAVVAVGGIGFAAFTTSAYINGTASAGTFVLAWEGPASGTGSASYNTCGTPYATTTTNSSDTLQLSAGNLAPGDYCTFTAVLADVGTLPGVVSDAVVSASGSCVWFFNDNFASHNYPPPETPQGSIGISPSAPINYVAYFGMEAGDGNACQGASISLTVDVTATAT
jgi:nitrate reductase NapE component